MRKNSYNEIGQIFEADQPVSMVLGSTEYTGHIMRDDRYPNVKVYIPSLGVIWIDREQIRIAE